jgi:hypothetical protein
MRSGEERSTSQIKIECKLFRYCIENQKLRDVVHAQKIMIGKMELELASKTMTINYLTHELTKIMTSGGGGGHTVTVTPPSANDMLMF